jgi:hypothetical protein
MLIKRRPTSAYRVWGPVIVSAVLLFFLLSAKRQVDRGGGRIHDVMAALCGVPPAPTPPNDATPREMLVVTLLPSGTLQFGETNLTAEALLRQLAARPDRAACDVRVIARRNQPFDRVLALSGQLQKLGYRRVLLGLPDDEAGPPPPTTNAPPIP